MTGAVQISHGGHRVAETLQVKRRVLHEAKLSATAPDLDILEMIAHQLEPGCRPRADVPREAEATGCSTHYQVRHAVAVDIASDWVEIDAGPDKDVDNNATGR
jgi:hypothetical protein